MKRIIAVTLDIVTNYKVMGHTRKEQPPAKKQHKKPKRCKLPHMTVPGNDNKWLETDFAQKL